jgi:rhamnosyltransferase
MQSPDQLSLTLPKIAVCLAAYNGKNYLSLQIESILAQKEVVVTVFVSVDVSADGTEDWIDEFALKDSRVVALTHGEKFGSAASNFYRILRDVDFTQFDFISFSDQDDIWELDKLIRHTQLAIQHKADGVSSNVLAFWPNGKQKLIVKSQPQKKLDFLFESAGPGCTFLMSPWLVSKVREQLVNEHSLAKNVVLHDWLTYAVCRSHGHTWIIDALPTVQYRQHQSNVIGANSGLKAKLARLIKLKQGWYRSEVIKLCAVCALISGDNEFKFLGSLLSKKTIHSQFKLLVYVAQARRKFLDRLALFFSIVLFIF